jgi:glutamate transport system permease protein
MRVSPVPPLRWAGTLYVNLVRNTPLTVVFFLVVFGLPRSP